MKWPIRLVPEAKAEFDADADWYEEKQIGLGVDFVAKDVLNRIAKNPRIHATIHGDVRKAVVQRFPYIVLCVEEPDEVVVIAVFHTSRDPAIWKKRPNGEPRV
jgi:plasmid stabilization system protein ParE